MKQPGCTQSSPCGCWASLRSSPLGTHEADPQTGQAKVPREQKTFLTTGWHKTALSCADVRAYLKSAHSAGYLKPRVASFKEANPYTTNSIRKETA